MVKSRAHVGLLAFVLLICSCSETPSPQTSAPSQFTVVSSEKDADSLDTNITEDVEPDPCESLTPASGAAWCDCQPLCCQSQEWFCSPFPGEPTFLKKQVILNVCNANNEACSYPADKDCPPPQVLFEGACQEAYECPPSAQNLDYGWQWCDLPDGSIGKQDVKCDKGQLFLSECVPCEEEICDGIDNDCDDLIDEDILTEPCVADCGEGVLVCVDGEKVCYESGPQEEICDGIDNDCDGETDEDELNTCGDCGPVPSETCNFVDDDCDGLVDEDLAKVCSTDCGTGVEVCMFGSWVGCTAKQPSQEICDGIDNDCDGAVDEELECICSVQDVGKLFPCAESPLICGQGYKSCECLDENCLEIVSTPCYANCYWLANPPGSDPNCDEYVGVALAQEDCNAFDDNCNTLIDEDLMSTCYTGPEGTLGVGICESGTLVCDMGAWGSYDQNGVFLPNVCADEVLPQDEECNGIDDDCDGEADWGEDVPETDILFVVDWSGSMVTEISAVLIALNQFSQNYALESKLNWGLIVGPRQLEVFGEQRLQLISDIAPLEDFLTEFANLGNTGMLGGNEMLLDALYIAYSNISASANINVKDLEWDQVGESIPPKDQFKVTWRPGADRVVIVFSDEFAQSFLTPKISVNDVTSACMGAPSSKLYAFSTNSFWGWGDIASACGGKYFPLTNDPTEMYNYLMEILDEVCSKSEN